MRNNPVIALLILLGLLIGAFGALAALVAWVLS